MGLAQGVAAGLATGGRFSGLGDALKVVLQNQAANKAMQGKMDITRQVTDRDMALKMLALNKLAGASGELPQEMTDAGYRTFGGKVYRTQNLKTPERYPGENATMQAGYLSARLGAIDKLIQTAPDQSTRVFLQKEKIRMQQEYAGGLNQDNNLDNVNLEPSGWDKFSNYMGQVGQSASSMLGNAGNTIMDMLDQGD